MIMELLNFFSFYVFHVLMYLPVCPHLIILAWHFLTSANINICVTSIYMFSCIFWMKKNMDPNTSFLMNTSCFQSVYYEAKENEGIIDLGLSLRALQLETYHHHPSAHLVSLEGYDGLIDWPNANSLNLKNVNVISPRTISETCDEEAEGVQSKERWAYVKVNMDGIVIGRKICVLDYCGYSSLAFQLEDMFGRQSVSGWRLFQFGSEFSLLYKDRDDNWRTVGDVPWREFVECVKRLRIARKK